MKKYKKENCHYNNKKRIAFTLAETLITLTILGIIAVITVTSIVRYYKKSVVETKLKLAYSIIVNATDLAEVELNQNSDDWDYVNGNNFNSNYIKNKLLPYLPVAQECSSSVHCLGDEGKKLKGQSDPGYTYINLGNGQYSNLYWAGSSGVILKNGMSIMFNRCLVGSSGFGVSNYYCQCFVDIDGPKKGANQLNKDIFVFYYTAAEPDTQTYNPRFSPYTVEWHLKRNGITTDCTKNSNCLNVKSGCKNGNINSTCFAYIMMNGWKIPNDYPVKF